MKRLLKKENFNGFLQSRHPASVQSNWILEQ